MGEQLAFLAAPEPVSQARTAPWQRAADAVSRARDEERNASWSCDGGRAFGWWAVRETAWAESWWAESVVRFLAGVLEVQR